jgi:alpha-L-rhamnosidase
MSYQSTNRFLKWEILFSIIVFSSSILSAVPYQKKISVIDLRCESLTNPLSIGTAVPRFSWKLQSDRRGTKQTAYRVIVSDNIKDIKNEKGDFWDSGKIFSDQSENILFHGKVLYSRLKLYWAVKIWDEKDSSTKWSECAVFETGLLNKNDWKALWIGTESHVHIDSAETEPAPYFRKDFSSNKRIKSARAYVSGLGFYEFYINGTKIGNQVLAPAVTNFDKRPLKKLLYPYDDQSTQRVLYNTFDVSKQIKDGQNTIGMILGNGWYNQRDRTVEGNMWYDTPRMILQLEIIYENGERKIIASDSSWKYSTGPILHDGIFSGEIYDARLQTDGWNKNGFDDSRWKEAKIVWAPTGDLQPQLAPFDKIIRTISPSSVQKTNDSTYLFFLDEMISGWAELKIKGSAGDKISLRFIGEEEKSFKQSDTYFLRGGKTETWKPRFTWHAFRKIEVVSKNIPLTKKNILIKVVNTDVEQAGSFECSNNLFNKIYNNYLRTQRANFHGSISSDCPHRERLGYTGDAQVITDASIYSFDMTQFYRKYFKDIEDARNKKTGYIPHTAPFGGGGGGPAWGSAFVIMPWKYFCYYGDKNILENYYEGMKQWISYLTTRTDERGIIVREEPNGWCLGDWSAPEKVEIPEPLVNTCYYFHVTDIMKNIARILGKTEDENSFAVLSRKIKDDFNRVFFDNDKKQYWQGRQGANVFPLAFGLVPEENKKDVFNSLLSHLEKLNYHFDTGILATPLLLEVLTDNNRTDLAYRLMDQKDFPSYGYYILEKDATCLWEDWDGRSSHCHPMFGSVTAWFYETLAGISYDYQNPGMQHFIIAPQPCDSLTWCKASYNSIYGKITSHWEKEKDSFVLDVQIPANTTADVYLPTESKEKIFESGRQINSIKEIKFTGVENKRTVLQIGSGKYHFKIR